MYDVLGVDFLLYGGLKLCLIGTADGKEHYQIQTRQRCDGCNIWVHWSNWHEMWQSFVRSNCCLTYEQKKSLEPAQPQQQSRLPSLTLHPTSGTSQSVGHSQHQIGLVIPCIDVLSDDNVLWKGRAIHRQWRHYKDPGWDDLNIPHLLGTVTLTSLGQKRYFAPHKQTLSTSSIQVKSLYHRGKLPSVPNQKFVSNCCLITSPDLTTLMQQSGSGAKNWQMRWTH